MSEIPEDFAAALASLEDPDTLTALLEGFYRAEADTLAWFASVDDSAIFATLRALDDTAPSGQAD